MSNINCFKSVSPDFSTEGSCSRILKSENEIKMNGDMCSENLLPNNNICDEMVSSLYIKKEKNEVLKDCDSYESVSQSTIKEDCEDSSEMEVKEESDNCSANASEDTNSINDGSTTDYQNMESRPSDPYRVNNEKPFGNVNFEHSEHSNGVVRKTNHKKKKLSSGPGRGRPRKALVAMYHSQISGDKDTIKIRIKKSNYTTQVQVSTSRCVVTLSLRFSVCVTVTIQNSFKSMFSSRHFIGNWFHLLELLTKLRYSFEILQDSI